MEDRLDEVQRILMEMFPGAVRVDVTLLHDGITAVPRYRTNAVGYSMRTINGTWIRREPT